MSRNVQPTTEMQARYTELWKRRRRLLQSGAHTAHRKLPHFVKTEIDMLNASIRNLERTYAFITPEEGSSK